MVEKKKKERKSKRKEGLRVRTGEETYCPRRWRYRRRR
jgi:hypothetical protein